MADELAVRIVALERLFGVVSLGDLGKVYDESMAVLRDIIRVDEASLQMVDKSTGKLIFVAALHDFDTLKSMDVPIDDESVSGVAFRTESEQVFPDSWQHPRFGARQRELGETKGLRNRSYICVPLRVRDSVFGVLNVLHGEPDRFTQDDLVLVRALASFISAAVQRAKLVEMLLQVSLTVSAYTENLTEVCDKSLAAIQLGLGAEFGSIQILDDGKQFLRFIAAIQPADWASLKTQPPIPVDENSVSGYVVCKKETLWLEDSWSHERFGERQQRIASESNFGNRSYICLPLCAHNEVLGVLNILHPQSYHFSSEDCELAKVLAAHIGAAIYNAKQVQYVLNVERVSAIANAVKILAHDISNNVSLIRLYAATPREELNECQQLDKLYKLWPRQDLLDSLANIEGIAEETIGLIEDLRNLRYTGGTEPTKVYECVARALHDVERWTSGVDVWIDPAIADVERVVGTKDLIEIFKNLFRNACDAMSRSTKKEIRVNFVRPSDGYIRLIVEDTGPGVKLDYITGPLFSLGSSSRSGGGTGLWHARLLLQRWGGSIFWDESYKDGARFVVDLAVAQQQE